jgi:hypothetical protein
MINLVAKLVCARQICILDYRCAQSPEVVEGALERGALDGSNIAYSGLHELARNADALARQGVLLQSTCIVWHVLGDRRGVVVPGVGAGDDRQDCGGISDGAADGADGILMRCDRDDCQVYEGQDIAKQKEGTPPAREVRPTVGYERVSVLALRPSVVLWYLDADDIAPAAWTSDAPTRLGSQCHGRETNRRGDARAT